MYRAITLLLCYVGVKIGLHTDGGKRRLKVLQGRVLRKALMCK
jgi:hypothetical protein